MLFMMITMLFSTAVMANQNQTQEINKFLGSPQIRKKSEENSEFHGGFKIDLTEALNDSHTSYERQVLRGWYSVSMFHVCALQIEFAVFDSWWEFLTCFVRNPLILTIWLGDFIRQFSLQFPNIFCFSSCTIFPVYLCLQHPIFRFQLVIL